jgi:hypothetical protein
MTENKIAEVFLIQNEGYMVPCKFGPEGRWLKPHGCFWALNNNPWRQFLLIGRAEIAGDKK